MLIATATGNLGRDAELKKVGEGSVCEFNIAVKTSFKRDAPPTWVRCSIWGNRGVNLAEHLVKGTKVTVVGALSLREYQTKQGEARTSVEIDVRDLDFTGGAGSGGDRGATTAAAGQVSIDEARRILDEPDTDGIPF